MKDRKRLRSFAILATSLVASALAAAAMAKAPSWSLAWEDDFDSFDESRWRRPISTRPTNNSLHAYLPEQVTVENGNLVLTATDEPYEGLAYRSGRVKSNDEQRFGRWEVRAKLPTSRGMWPAIWLLPSVERYPWPGGGEIDIMENRGNQPTLTSSAFHYGTKDPFVHEFVTGEQQTAVGGVLTDYHADFHIYGVDWSEQYLRFYVDGVHHYTVWDEDVAGFLSQKTQPMQVILNNAVGGDFLPNPDATTKFPQRMEVDWVKVYTLDDKPGVARFRNGGFEAEENGGAEVNGLAGWTRFGANTAQIQNVLAASEAVRTGNTSLKLYGAFGQGDAYSGVSQGVSVVPGDRVRVSLASQVRSSDSLSGGANRALLKVEFYSEFGAKYGSDAKQGEHETVVADGESPPDEWRDHRLDVVVPAGAVEARVVVLFHQPGADGGAVHIDDVELKVSPPLAGDFNADNRIDAADYSVWRDTQGEKGYGLAADGDRDGLVGPDDYNLWKANVGAAKAKPKAADRKARPE